jgi:hypothetical protein
MRLRRPKGPANRLPRLDRRRLGVFALLFVFVAGMAMATGFSAMATDVTVDGLAATVDSTSTGDESTTSTEGDSTEAATTTEEAATTTVESSPAAGSTSTEETVSEPPAPPSSEGATPPPSSGGSEGNPEPAPGPVLAPKHHHVHPAPETREGGSATVWLHRLLPDPTPPAQRLSPRFARQLRQAARAADVRWSLILAVLRAKGHDGRVPAGEGKLNRLAARLAAHRARVLGHGEFADQVYALARYNRAVGLRALVTGLDKAKPRLQRRVLRDEHIVIYPGGRVDVALGHVDVRVLVLIRYLRVTFHYVTVTSLISGHRYYARPGVVSAHMYGLAVDIAAVDRVPIIGNQQPGGITEKAIEAILRLPSELQPQQVISLLGLGGPSFPLADHYDHIHVGF